jgi:hypothetical protein
LHDYTASTLQADVLTKQAGSKNEVATVALLLTTCLAYSSTLKMQSVFFSETSMNYCIQRHYASNYNIFLISISFVGWLWLVTILSQLEYVREFEVKVKLAAEVGKTKLS